MLTFDSQPPTITDLALVLRSANPLTTERIEVQLEVTDDFAGVQGSGFDAAASTFELSNAKRRYELKVRQRDDGTSRFAFRSECTSRGMAHISLLVTLVDRAGQPEYSASVYL